MSDLKQSNIHLALEVSRQGILPAETLGELLQECNEQGKHLGQTLVQKNYLQMSDIVKLMQSVAHSKIQTSPAEESREMTMAFAAVTPAQAAPPCFGDYEILGEIARGGMGIVYRARQKGIDRVVALKVLISGNLAGSSQIQRFLREAKVIAALNHPNIIPLYSMGEEAGNYYFTMKCVDGGTFDEVMKSEMPLQEKIAIVAKVCHALEHAHQHQIWHRDLKPSNILLDKDGTPYLTDFGLAKVVDSKSALTQTGTLLGTPYYMSPEQARGEKRQIDNRSDIYSMGVILYQTMTRKLPFTSDVLADLARKITEEEPPPPRKLNPAVPIDLESICLRAMEKSPGARYPSALALAEDLDRFCRGQKVRRFNLKGRLARAYRRHRAKFALGIVAAALLLVAIAGSYWFYKRGEGKDIAEAKAKVQAAEACRAAEELFAAGRHAPALQVLKNSRNLQRYEVYLALGKFLQELERLPEAREAFDRAFYLDPTAAEVLYARSLFHSAVGEERFALEAIDAYLGCNRESSRGYRQRAMVLNKMGRAAEAQHDIAIANDLEKRDLERQLEEALACAEDYAVASKKFEDLLARHPSYEKGYVARAKLHRQKGEYQRALSDISRAIELNPHHDYFILKGRWLWESGYTQEAHEHLNQFLSRVTDTAMRREIHLLLADCSLKQGRYSQAHASYLDAFAGREPERDHLVEMGHCALETGNLDTAEAYLQKAATDTSLAPKSRGDAHYHLGRLYQKRQRNEQARKAWEMAIELKTAHSDTACLLLGTEYLRRQKFSKAVKCLEKAAQAFPENARIHWDLGNCHLKTVKEVAQGSRPLSRDEEDANRRKRELAIDAFSRCITLEPWKAEYYYERGMTRSALQEYTKAENDLLVYLQIRPDNPGPLMHIIENMFQEGMIDNYHKMNVLCQNYTRILTRTTISDLFATEWTALFSKCIQEKMAWQDGQGKRTWKVGEAETLIAGLIHSDSPAVHEMAVSGILPMYRSPELRELVASRSVKSEYPASVKRRLADLSRRLTERHIGDLKVEFRQLLLRYYRTSETTAMEKMYDCGNSGYLCLESLLADEKEDAMIRFLAARALRDIHVPEAYRVLLKNADSGSDTARIFSHVAIRRESGETRPGSSGVFARAVSIGQPYVRAMAALHAPVEDRETLHKFLDDADIRVRLCAAKRLRPSGDPRAEKELLQAHSGAPLASIHAYAILVYWDPDIIGRDALAKERCMANLPVLEKALEDKDPEVRRIALSRLSEVGGKKYTSLLTGYLRDEYPPLRFQAIYSLAKNMELDPLMPLVIDVGESLPVRMAVVEGMLAGTKNTGQQIPTHLMLNVVKLLEDPDPRIRLAMISTAAKANAKMMVGYVQQHKSDFAVRAGFLFSLLGEPHAEMLPYALNALADEHPQVRTIAATAAIYIAGKLGLPELGKIHERLKNSSPELKRAGAVGYFKRIEDEVSKQVASLPSQHLWDMDKFTEHYVQNLLEKAAANDDLAQKFVRLYGDAVDLDPENPKYHFERGIVHYTQKNYRQSVADIERAVALDPGKDYFRTWLADAYTQSGQHARALELVDKYPHLFRSTPDLCLLKAAIFKACGDRDRSVAALEEASLWTE